MAKKLIQPKGLFDSRGTYGYSFAVQSDNTVYLAGLVARDAKGNLVGRGDIEAQVDQIFANMRVILKEAGGSPKDVVYYTIYTKDIRQYRDDCKRFCDKHFGKGVYPPATLVQVSSLAPVDALLEIAAVAVIDKEKKANKGRGRKVA
ncbi:MAG: RidA family protein [Dehalococcoidia bacterium]|nr:RidA family protein [Dehalococcoidia bacterium]